MPRAKGTTTRKVETSKENGKDFIVQQKEGTSLYSIHYDNGGQVPKDLQGLFTSEHTASLAIQSYKGS